MQRAEGMARRDGSGFFPLLSSLYGRHKAIIINCIDILLLTDHISKATAGRIFETDAPRLVPKNSLNIIPVVQLIIKALWYLYFSARVPILNHDDMVWLEEISPA
jgi:hypothetical protein